jgi:hypothetical protein
MRTTHLRRAVPAALALVLVLVAAVPTDPVEARSPKRKIEPRSMTTYRVGRPVTPNTDVLSTSGYAAWMIDEVLGVTTGLPKLGSSFLDAERREGINARTFVAHAMLESGWGTSDIARLKRNLFGYGAYDRNPWRYATRFRSYRQGILTVARKIREGYLSPDGRYWYRFTTLRAMNRYYASDVRWADKIAVIANGLDRLVVTLKERGLHFGPLALAGAPTVGAPVSLELPWRAHPGAVLPPAIRFAARWMPVALMEADGGAFVAAPAPAWTLARRTNGPGRVVHLGLQAPSEPGLWRLEVEARDSDGKPLPKSDRPAIGPLTVRVTAAREASIGLAVDPDGILAATVTSVGREPIEAAGAGISTVVEAWALPLDPSLDAYRLAEVRLAESIAAGGATVVRFGAPATPSVVAVRLAGDGGAIGRVLPAVALVTVAADGPPVLVPIDVASPRDDALLGRTSLAGRIAAIPATEPGTIRVDVAGGAAAQDPGLAVAAMEGPPGRPWLLVRSIGVEPSRAAEPVRTLLELPAEPVTPVRLDITGLPAGVRLVMAGLAGADGTPVDPASLVLAWIQVATIEAPLVAPH